MKTVNLPSGLLGEQKFASDTHYIGHANGTVIENKSTADNTHTARFDNQHDIIIENITFSRNGIKGDHSKRIKITKCTFKDCRRTDGDHQAINTFSPEDWEVVDCIFDNNIYGSVYNGLIKNLHVHHNLFKHCGFMIKGMCDPGSRGIVFEWNATDEPDGCHYQVEFQPNLGQRDNPDYGDIYCRDNAYRKPRIGTDTNNTGGWSLPFEKARRRIEIVRNHMNGILANGQRHPKGPAMVIEASGQDTLVEHNWIEHCHDPVAVNDSSIKTICRNNRLFDNQEPANMTSDGPPGQNVFENNGPNVQLPEIGGWKLFGISSGGTIVPATITSPVVGKTFAPGETFTATSTGGPITEIDIEGDNAAPVWTGSSASAQFTVPLTATSAQKVRITAGSTVARFPIVAGPTPPDEVADLKARILILEQQLATTGADKAALTADLNKAKAALAEIHLRSAP